MRINLNEFKHEVHENAVAHGWWGAEYTDAAAVALVHAEISEALEEWRANRPMVYYKCRLDTICNGECKHDAASCVYKNPKPEGIAVELIDVVLRILDTAEAWGVSFGNIEILGTVLISEPYKIDVAEYTLPDLVVLLHGIVTAFKNAKAFGMGMELQHDFTIAVYAIFTWLRANNVDPEALMREKHEYNKTRSFRHGGKRI